MTLKTFVRLLLSIALAALFLTPLLIKGGVLFCAIAAITALSLLFATFASASTAAFFSALLAFVGLCSAILIANDFRLFSPAVAAFILSFSFPVFLSLRLPPKKTTPTQTRTEATQSLPLPRCLIFSLSWLVGLMLIALKPSPYAPALFFGFSCLMLLASAHHLWPFALTPEWLGYKTRRKIFVSKKKYVLQSLSAAVLLILWSIAAYHLAHASL